MPQRSCFANSNFYVILTIDLVQKRTLAMEEAAFFHAVNSNLSQVKTSEDRVKPRETSCNVVFLKQE